MSFKNYIKFMTLILAPAIPYTILLMFFTNNFIHTDLYQVIFEIICTILVGYPYIKYTDWLEKKELI